MGCNMKNTKGTPPTLQSMLVLYYILCRKIKWLAMDVGLCNSSKMRIKATECVL